MSEQVEFIFIECQTEVSGSIKEELDKISPSTTSATEKRKLDGSAPTWILAASVFVSALPSIIGALKSHIESKKVTKIEFEGVLIENPQPEDLEILRGAISAYLDKKA